MSKRYVQFLIQRVWDIDGYPNYFFGDDKHLYRYDSRGQVHRNKQILIGYTRGYVLKQKFYSLNQLRPLLRRHEATDHPADF